jgi:hypothetical protein
MLMMRLAMPRVNRRCGDREKFSEDSEVSAVGGIAIAE